MASTKDQDQSMFEVVDIRAIPDDELEDLLGGGIAHLSPQLKFL